MLRARDARVAVDAFDAVAPELLGALDGGFRVGQQPLGIDDVARPPPAR